MNKHPIFIGGMYKSGTSLLRAMLGQHSNIATGLETFWFDLGRGSADLGALEEATGRLADYFSLPPSDVREFHARSVSPEEFLDWLMTEVAASQGKPRWLEKTPGNITHVDRIWAAWPRAQFLHIVRDPRDVFASLVQANKWSNPDDFAERWCSTIGKGERLVASIDPPCELYKVVRYEGLIAEPEVTIREVLEFLGEPWEPGVATFNGRENDFQKVLAATGKASTTLERLKQPLTAQRVAIWKQTLSDTQVEEIRLAIAKRGFGDVYKRITSEQ